MTEQEQVKRIIDKYNQSIPCLTNNGILEEMNTVFQYIIDQANKRQRQLVGLEDED